MSGVVNTLEHIRRRYEVDGRCSVGTFHLVGSDAFWSEVRNGRSHDGYVAAFET